MLSSVLTTLGDDGRELWKPAWHGPRDCNLSAIIDAKPAALLLAMPQMVVELVMAFKTLEQDPSGRLTRFLLLIRLTYPVPHSNSPSLSVCPARACTSSIRLLSPLVLPVDVSCDCQSLVSRGGSSKGPAPLAVINIAHIIPSGRFEGRYRWIQKWFFEQHNLRYL